MFLFNSHLRGSVPLYETTVLFIMDCNGYVWNIFNIFKKEKKCCSTFLGENDFSYFVFNSFLRLYIFYRINKQNHPEKGDFLF